VKTLALIAALTLASVAVAEAACDDVFGSSFEQIGAPASVISSSAQIQTSDGVNHTWFYRVPATAPPIGGRPVLIWLHGDGGNGSNTGVAFRPFTDLDGAILITPSGINNTWTHASADLPGLPQDAQFISLLIDSLIANGVAGARVDRRRIYLGGESRGAYMPYFLLQRPSTKFDFAAVAVNAGLLYCQAGDGDCEASAFSATRHNAPTPILHLHGTNDAAVAPPPTSTFNNPINWSVDWRVFNPIKFWALQNGCFSGSNSNGRDDGIIRENFMVGGNSATRYDLTGNGASCSKYQLILVNNGGHVIGGQSERIWTFLKGYCRVDSN